MIIILGGKGFVGSGFQRYLEKTGTKHVVIGHENYDQYIGQSCDILINANGNSKKFLAKDDPKAEFQASVASVRNSLVDFQFGKYIYLSTSDVYPDCSDTPSTREETLLDITRQSPYGFHKYIAEQCVRHAAKDWLIIRMGGFVGLGMKKNAVYDVLHGDKLWVHPDSAFQFISTDDSARLVMQLTDRNVSCETVNVTAKGTITVGEIMKLAGRTVAHDPSARPVRYEISTTKAEFWLKLPQTVDTVRDFLKQIEN